MKNQSSNYKKGAGFFNKNSAYIESLVSYINDTKPYHSKLSEIIEEYQFSESIHVKFNEKLQWFNKLDSHWGYQWLSSGNPNTRLTPISKLLTNLFQDSYYTVGKDENTDLIKVPFAYSKSHFDGAGVAKVRMSHGPNNTNVSLVESVDYHQSLGSFEFMIKQTYDERGTNPDGTPNRTFNPLWQTTQDYAMIAMATRKTRKMALDESNPNSSVVQLRALFNSLAKYLVDHSIVATTVSKYITEILDILNGVATEYNPNPQGPSLPYMTKDPKDEYMLYSPYTFLFDAINNDPVVSKIPEFNTTILGERVQYFSPPLFFIPVTDRSMYETGIQTFSIEESEFISISDITITDDCPAQEWEVLCSNSNTQSYKVSGSVTGYMGVFVAGDAFKPGKYISFKTKKLATAPEGSKLSFYPINRISVSESAHPDESRDETWNLIKTNPIAHNRPAFVSERIGGIYNKAGELGYVDLISPFNKNSFIAEYVSGNEFKIYCPDDPTYNKVAYANKIFSDDLISFTIKSGSIPFHSGDMFIIEIENGIAYVSDLEMSFGFDVDAFDNDHLTDDQKRAIGFYFDSRYSDIDMSEYAITVDENVKHNRKWRLTALPDKSKPISTKKKDGTGPNQFVDAEDATSGVAPDPALNSPAVYTKQPDGLPDLELYYASVFSLTYSDDDFVTISKPILINIGDSFEDAGLGIKITTKSQSESIKPLIGVIARGLENRAAYESGDIISFITVNTPPEVINEPITLRSEYIPRLVPFSSGFYYAPGAKWEINMLSPLDFTITARDVNTGKIITGYPKTGTLDLRNQNPIEGLSYKDEYVHFVIEPGVGLQARDSFTFETFDRKPTFLVHGSETGYTEPAVVGEFYWNGLIGFKIDNPSYYITDGIKGRNVWSGDKLNDFNALLRVNRIRVDHETVNYDIIKNGNKGYAIYHHTKGFIGHIAYGGGVWYNEQIEIEIVENGVMADGRTINSFFGDSDRITISVLADGLEVFNSRDIVIIKTDLPVLTPRDGDKITVTKTLGSRMEFNITPGTAPLTGLMPQFINANLIDVNTNTPEGLSATSPEALILNGWIPTIPVKWDSTTSLARFYDQATTYEYFSVGTGERLGRTVDLPDEYNPGTTKTQFEWDANFIQNHLPTNAAVNIVTNNQGWREKVSVFMNESIKYVIGSHGLDQTFNMSDIKVGVKMYESQFTYIDTNPNGKAAVSIDDSFHNGKAGEVSGFLPGFGNVLFDAEYPVFKNGVFSEDESKAFYDMAVPIDLESLLVHFGNTPEKVKAIYDMWNFYLRVSGTFPTSIEDWAWVRDKMKVDEPYGQKTVPEFGIPYKGLAIENESDESVSVSPDLQDHTEILNSISPDLIGFSAVGFDTDLFDDDGLSILTVTAYSKPPTKAAYQKGMTWDNFAGYFDTGTVVKTINGVPTEVDLGVDRITLVLPVDSPNAHFDVWYADNKLGAPSRAIPYKVNGHVYQVEIPRLVRVKLDVYL